MNRFETLYFLEQLGRLLFDGLGLDGDPILFIFVLKVPGQVDFAERALPNFLIQLVLFSQHGCVYFVLTVFLLHSWSR